MDNRQAELSDAILCTYLSENALLRPLKKGADLYLWYVGEQMVYFHGLKCGKSVNTVDLNI